MSTFLKTSKETEPCWKFLIGAVSMAKSRLNGSGFRENMSEGSRDIESDLSEQFSSKTNGKVRRKDGGSSGGYWVMLQFGTGK